MRTVFFGTPSWALPSLDALLASDVEVVAVVTNPDRAAGRGLAARAPPVKLRALEAGVEILQPERARDPRLEERLQELAIDVATVVAYGKILPASLLRLPPLGFVNVHFSLLPAYRGAAPVQRALLDGAEETGVSIMLLTEGMDEGPLLATQPVPIDPGDTAGTLGERLARAGALLLVPVLKEYAAGRVVPEPQDERRASYAPKVGDEDARIDWTRPAAAVRNLVRACNPSPGAWTSLGDRRLKVYRAEEAAAGRALAPGELAWDRVLLAGTGNGVLSLDEVQLAGRRRMTGAELARGLRLPPGARLV